MANSMCPLDCAAGSSMLGVSVRLSLDEMDVWAGGLRTGGGPPH
jgi:hypothetical protein